MNGYSHPKQRPYNLPLVYNPTVTRDGYAYYTIRQIFRVLIDRCDVKEVKDLCENALSSNPVGLDLRNNYILPIRVELQGWHQGTTISIVVKLMLTRILEDTVADPRRQKLDYKMLTLGTLVAFDQNKLKQQPFGVE